MVYSWLAPSTLDRTLPGAMCCVLGRDTLLSKCLCPPRCIMGSSDGTGELSTVEPRSTDTRLIQTPALLFIQAVLLSRQKAHLFSLKLTRFIRTPGNTDNGHFSVFRVTNSHILSTPLYGQGLSAHCLFSLSLLCDNCRHCTLFKINNTELC